MPRSKSWSPRRMRSVLQGSRSKRRGRQICALRPAVSARSAPCKNPMDAGAAGTGHRVTQYSLYLALRPGLTDSSCPVEIYRPVKTLVAQRIGRKLPSECDPNCGIEPGCIGWGDCPDGAELVIKIIGGASGDRVEVKRNAVSLNGLNWRAVLRLPAIVAGMKSAESQTYEPVLSGKPSGKEVRDAKGGRNGCPKCRHAKSNSGASRAHD